MIEINRILVPTDFSDNAHLALEFAASIINKYESQLFLLHVIPDPAKVTSLYDQIDHGIPADWIEKMRVCSDQELDKISGKKLPGCENITRATLQGDTFTEICKYATENSIALIVIGTHGRTATVHHMLGSLTDKIINRAPCPVLTVPAPTHDFEMP